MEPNIVLLVQPLMKNGSWNIGRKSYERETCMFHELENIFKIVKLEEVLWWKNEISGVKNPPKTFFEIKIVLLKQEWMKLHSSSNMKTLKEVGVQGINVTTWGEIKKLFMSILLGKVSCIFLCKKN